MLLRRQPLMRRSDQFGVTLRGFRDVLRDLLGVCGGHAGSCEVVDECLGGVFARARGYHGIERGCRVLGVLRREPPSLERLGRGGAGTLGGGETRELLAELVEVARARALERRGDAGVLEHRLGARLGRQRRRRRPLGGTRRDVPERRPPVIASAVTAAAADRLLGRGVGVDVRGARGGTGSLLAHRALLAGETTSGATPSRAAA